MLGGHFVKGEQGVVSSHYRTLLSKLLCKAEVYVGVAVDAGSECYAP